MGRNNLLFYVAVLLLFGIGISVILNFGTHLQLGEAVPKKRAESSQLTSSTPHQPQSEASSRGMGNGLSEKFRHPLSVLLLQIIVITLATRVLGMLFLKLKQPAIIGEIVAGILLGPSCVGMLLPEVQALVFPPLSMDALRLLSQMGVILFMFAVGMEFDMQHLRQKAHAAVLVSHASRAFRKSFTSCDH
jgi:hypothetical protein